MDMVQRFDTVDFNNKDAASNKAEMLRDEGYTCRVRSRMNGTKRVYWVEYWG